MWDYRRWPLGASAPAGPAVGGYYVSHDGGGELEAVTRRTTAAPRGIWGASAFQSSTQPAYASMPWSGGEERSFSPAPPMAGKDLGRRPTKG